MAEKLTDINVLDEEIEQLAYSTMQTFTNADRGLNFLNAAWVPDYDRDVLNGAVGPVKALSALVKVHGAKAIDILCWG